MTHSVLSDELASDRNGPPALKHLKQQVQYITTWLDFSLSWYNVNISWIVQNHNDLSHNDFCIISS